MSIGSQYIYIAAAHAIVGDVIKYIFIVTKRVTFTIFSKQSVSVHAIDISGHGRSTAYICGIMVIIEINTCIQISFLTDLRADSKHSGKAVCIYHTITITVGIVNIGTIIYRPCQLATKSHVSFFLFPTAIAYTGITRKAF